LVSLPDLMTAMIRHPCQKTRAAALGVSESIYAARLMSLQPSEQTMIDVCVRRCVGLMLSPLEPVEAVLAA